MALNDLLLEMRCPGLAFDVRITKASDVGAAVLTPREIRFRKAYRGDHRHLQLHFPDGKCLQVPILRPH